MLGANLVPRGCDLSVSTKDRLLSVATVEGSEGSKDEDAGLPDGRSLAVDLLSPSLVFTRAGCKLAHMIKTHFYLLKLTNLRSFCKDFGRKM